MQYVTKESLQAARKICPRVDVTTSAGVFPCQGFTTLALQQYRIGLEDMENRDYVPAIIMQLGCIDPEGKPLFTDADHLWLVELPADVTEKVINVILELSGVGKDAEEAIVKNSTPAEAGPDSE